MKRIIIAGGGGQMGRALAGDLAKDGYQVILLSRNPEKVGRLPQNVSAEKWDGLTAQGWGELANGATAILNLAGENIGIPPIPWWLPGRKQRIRDSRVNAGRAIVEAVKNATEKPHAVIQASGINGRAPRDHSDRAKSNEERRHSILSCHAVQAVRRRTDRQRQAMVLMDSYSRPSACGADLD